MFKPIHHFYHIYADGFWQDACREHLSALKESRLLTHLTSLQIGLVGTPENRAAARSFLEATEVPFSICVEADEGWEQVTLNCLYDWLHASGGQTADAFFLYAHTKGAAYPSQVSRRWRKRMTDLVIHQWKAALAQLDIHDVAGCYWTGLYFAGTYWWATHEYLRTLKRPLGASRYDAESWIGEGAHARMFDLRTPSTIHCAPNASTRNIYGSLLLDQMN